MKSEAYLWMAIFLLAGVWIGFKDSLMLSTLSRGGDTNNFVFSQPQRASDPYPQQNWQHPQNSYNPYRQQPYTDPSQQYQNTNPNGYDYNQQPSGQYESPQTNRRPCNKTVRYHYQGL